MHPHPEQEKRERPPIKVLGHIDPKLAEFKLLDSGFLSLRVGEDYYPKVSLTRLFPYFYEDNYISVLVDHEEVGILDDINALPKDGQKVVRGYLQYKYYIPKVTSIQEAHEKMGYLYLTAMTAGGEKEICIADSASNIRIIHGQTVSIRDVEGNLYEIENFNEMDAASRQRIEIFL